jgi:hypothetical protein
MIKISLGLIVLSVIAWIWHVLDDGTRRGEILKI